MVSVIAENRPNEFLSITHICNVSRGIDDTDSAAVKAWAPAYENYTLREVEGGTEMAVINIYPGWWMCPSSSADAAVSGCTSREARERRSGRETAVPWVT